MIMSGLFFFLKLSCSRYSASFVALQSSNWGGREPRDESSRLGRGREEWVGIQTGQETQASNKHCHPQGWVKVLSKGEEHTVGALFV